MKKFFLNTLTIGALLGVAAASQAQQFTYNMLSGTTTFSTFPGAAPTSGTDPTITTFFTPLSTNPQVVSVPTVLQFGQDNTTPGTGAPSTTATFTAVPISFDFQVDAGTTIGATVNNFTAFGEINGDIGYDSTGTPFSRAQITYTSIVDNTTGETSIITPDPNNTLSSVGLFTTINGSMVSIYLDQRQSLPLPGGQFINQGFIAANPPPTVPEPGTVAMLMGMGVSGSAFLLRKRRRA